MASSGSKILFGVKCLPIENGICQVTVWIFRTLPVLLVVIGTVGNIINTFVLSRKKLRTTPCFLLVFLSLFDIFCLWALYLQTPLRLGFDIDVKVMSSVYCKMHTWLSVCSGAASVWTVAIFTIERLIFALFPHNTNIHLNRNKSIAIMAVIVFFIGAMLAVVIGVDWSSESDRSVDDHNSTDRYWSVDGNISVAGNMSVDDNWLDYENQLINGNLSMSENRTADENMSFYDNWSLDDSFRTNGNMSTGVILSSVGDYLTVGNLSAYGNSSTGVTINVTISNNDSSCALIGFDNGSGPTTWQVLILLLATFIPFLIVITGNITLLVHLYKRRRSGNAVDKQTTLLLIVIALMACTLGPFAIFVVTFQVLSTYLDKSYPVSELIYALIYTLVMCNHSLNFICYAWKGTLFKRECKAIWQEIKTLTCKCE